MRVWACLGLLLVTLTSIGQDLPLTADLDHDGIPDAREQALLERFQPTFFVSANDCDSLPAEFAPDSGTPSVVARNGTLYGQVFSHQPGFFEIHYYHLWVRDCGLTGHPLDTEHVSVLVRDDASQPVSESKAIYWYAAAHQDTMCDRSTAAQASALDAEDHGARVWISQGKHASFLRTEDCAKGCGQDRCERPAELKPPAVINVGEPGAPLNGAQWTASHDWPLAEKMRTDFSPELLARLAGSNGEVRASGSVPHAQGVISAGGQSVEAVAQGGAQASAAVSKAETQSHSAIGSGLRSVGRALKKAGKAIVRPGEK